MSNTESAPRWDLESIFPGGSKSEEYKIYREELKKLLDDLKTGFDKAFANIKDTSPNELIDLIKGLQTSYSKLGTVYGFVECLTAQDVEDDTALQIQSQAQEYHSQWLNIKTTLEAISQKLNDDAWNGLFNDEEIDKVKFYLNELRETAKLKMPAELEALAGDLAVNGYHAWNNIYNKMYGDTKVEYVEDGKTKQLSLGQVALKMYSSDRATRKQAFEKLTDAWQENSNLASMMLNAQAGFRLTLYKNRNWKSALFEPLLMGRIKQESLMAMWEAVHKSAPKLQKYVDAKKKILGFYKFMWYDQAAPVGKSSREFTFNEASKFIVEQINGFSTEMADFIRSALEKNWVEAENRPGKAGGGFCTSMGEKKQSRIFMTFDNTYDSLMTLAHEFGHAFHQSVVDDEPPFRADYTLGLAETASTFNELLVTDAALEQSSDPQEKLMLLDHKLSEALTMFCNLYSRFLFDLSFYKERANGTVSKDHLNEIMVEAQKKAFCGMLAPEGYHPEFWASKLHFFLTDIPFYNFPYTFGYLFSNKIYARAKTEGSGFFEKYKAILKDTGNMTSEDIIKKHLNEDITGIEFWQEAVDRITADIDPFVKMTEEIG